MPGQTDTKLNPGSAVQLYCSNGTAVLLLEPVPCPLHSTALNSIVDSASFAPTSILAMQIQSQHVEDDKSKQVKGTISQILLKKNG